MNIHSYISLYKRTYVRTNVREYVYMKLYKYKHTKVRVYISIPPTHH